MVSKIISIVFLYLFVWNLYAIEFPKDHTFHKDFGLEWCYFVGNLKVEGGQEIGYELSFFRANLNGKEEVFPVHFAISDITNRKHYTAQSIDRKIGNLADYNDSLIRSGDYKIEILGESNFKITANPRMQNISLELHLTASKREILLHGDKGYSIKSIREKNIYSYYYSIPKLITKGFLKIGDSKFVVKEGTSWMDHEWSFPILDSGNNLSVKKSLASKENSWDWICLNLEDGSDIMVFNFRKSKSDSSETFGTLRTSNGETIYFQSPNEIQFVAQDLTWKSPETNKYYPMKWKIISKDIHIEIEAKFFEQEFLGYTSTGNSYWEGAVKAKGFIKEKPTTGSGYLELKGY
ncbi:MAG: carotenoid 1,2-hydratase [Leptospiraceae bacterium]|nr:carotenoid 1,2-hydratase [Leptospiraceae bacterium]